MNLDTIKLLLSDLWDFGTTYNQIIERLANDEFFKVQAALANNSNCPKNILNKLFKKAHSNYDAYIVLSVIAKNPNFSSELKRVLRKEQHYQIVCYAAENPECPVDLLEKLSKNEDYRVKESVASNPNCPLNLLEVLSNDVDYRVRIGVAKNPRCKDKLLEKLYNDEEGTVKRATLKNPNLKADILQEWYDKGFGFKLEVLQNPSCPKHLLLKSFESLDTYERRVVSQNPNCPQEILEKLYDTEFRYYVLQNPSCPKHLLLKSYENAYFLSSIESIAQNPNCPIYILNELSKYETYNIRKYVAANSISFGDRLNFVIENINLSYLFFYLIDLYFSKILNAKDNDVLRDCINRKLLDKSCDEDILLYIGRKKNFEKFINKEASIRVKEILLEVNKRYLSASLNFDEVEDIKLKRTLLDLFTEVKSDKESYIDLNGKLSFESSKDITDFSKSIFEGSGIKPVITDSTLKKEDFYYGEYPIDKVNNFENWMLTKLYELKALEPSGNIYRVQVDGFTTEYYKEYMVKGRKFVKTRDGFIETKKIKWVYDEEKDCFVSEKALFGSSVMSRYDEIVDKTLKTYFIKDIYMVSKEDKKEIKERKKKEEEIEKVLEQERLRKEAIEEFKRKEEEEKKKKGEQLELQSKMLELLKKMDEIAKEMHELGMESSIKRKVISEELLIVDNGKYREIKEEYLPYLKYIALGGLNTRNLKVSGIDFRESDISINPQNVYNKDLSYASFDDENLSFKDLSGCNLIGADLSLDSNCYGYEFAIIDENTKLPSDKVGEKNEISK